EGGAVEVVAPAVSVVGRGHPMRLAELDRDELGIPGPDADGTTGRVSVRLIAILVCFAILDRSPVNAAENDSATTVLRQTAGAVVMIGKAATDVHILVRRAREFVRQNSNALQSIIMAHHLSDARVIKTGSPGRVDKDPEQLEIMDLNVVDREI